MARTRFGIAQIDLADRRERIASNGKDRDRPFRPVGDQRQRSGAIDRYARRTLAGLQLRRDRKSTRLNSSHTVISYAVFCLKKKKYRRSSDDRQREGITGHGW